MGDILPDGITTETKPTTEDVLMESMNRMESKLDVLVELLDGLIDTMQPEPINNKVKQEAVKRNKQKEVIWK